MSLLWGISLVGYCLGILSSDNVLGIWSRGISLVEYGLVGYCLGNIFQCDVVLGYCHGDNV